MMPVTEWLILAWSSSVESAALLLDVHSCRPAYDENVRREMSKLAPNIEQDVTPMRADCGRIPAMLPPLFDYCVPLLKRYIYTSEYIHVCLFQSVHITTTELNVVSK